MEKIKLSVIIASYNSSKTIEKCLQSLEHQMNREDFEVIVVDSSEDGTADIIKQQFPKVRLYTFSERRFPGNARNFGISQARGEILAFTDADCMVDQDWVSEIIRAHQTPYPAIGGTIDNGNPESYVGWGCYFCKFSQWMPRSQTCRMVEIPTCCLSLKRWAFDKYGPFLEGMYCSDTAFSWRLGKDRNQPLFVPSIKVSHIDVQSPIEFLMKKSCTENISQQSEWQTESSQRYKGSFSLWGHLCSHFSCSVVQLGAFLRIGCMLNNSYFRLRLCC